MLLIAINITRTGLTVDGHAGYLNMFHMTKEILKVADWTTVIKKPQAVNIRCVGILHMHSIYGMET